MKLFPAHIDWSVGFYHALLVLLLVKVFFQKNSPAEWIFLFIVLYLSRKCFQYSYDFYNIFGTMLALLAAKNISIKKLIHLDCIMRLIRIVFYMITPFLLLVPNHINISIGGRERTYFGWIHANAMGLDFMLLALDFFYLRKDKHKRYDCLPLFASVIFLDITANSRTAEVAILVLAIFMLSRCLLKEKLFFYFASLCAVASAVLAVGLSILGPYLYSLYPDFIISKTGTLGSRIMLTYQFYEEYGLSVYGFPVNDILCLDMLFAFAGLHWGLISFFILLTATIITLYYAIKHKKSALLVMLTLFFLYSSMETAQIYPSYSYFALLLGYYVMNPAARASKCKLISNRFFVR